MSVVPFVEAAYEYAEVGIATIPLEGKRPLVKNPGRFGVHASLQVAAKFPSANVGFWCGRRNNLTVVDIDSPEDSELRWALDTFGRSPIIVRTGSGKHHVWYRHNGERRRIRPIPGHAIDLLGEGGYSVAPPSVRPEGGKYEFLAGSLGEVANLPAILPSSLEKLVTAPSSATHVRRLSARAVATPEGRRNANLFNLALDLAARAPSEEVFLTELLRLNVQACNPPLGVAEVERMAKGIWGYKVNGRLWVGGIDQQVVVSGSALDRAISFPDALALYMQLRKSHGRATHSFAISPGGMASARLIGAWNKARYRNAVNKLCELGLVRRVYVGGSQPGDPSLYCFSYGG
jgi:hypothetical protein